MTVASWEDKQLEVPFGAEQWAGAGPGANLCYQET